jgi:hypothetical protein
MICPYESLPSFSLYIRMIIIIIWCLAERSGLANGFLLKALYQWHWISSALCLMGMLLFSITGITLNHASQIEATPRVTSQKAQIPVSLQQQLTQLATRYDGKTAPLPSAVQQWLAKNQSISLSSSQEAEWSLEEVYLPMPRAGGDAWLRFSLNDNLFEYELTDRGWISFANDLHKGRNTGVAWAWFIDVFAVACLLFSLTGLLILKFHAANRPLVWPIVGLGVILPALLVILFVH